MLSPVRPSVVCLSVTLVHPTQPVEIFGNVSTPFGTLAIHWHPQKILPRSSKGNPSVGGGVKRKPNIAILDVSKAISWKWFGTRCNLNKIPHVHLSLSVGSSIVPCSAVVRDLGVLLDSELSMKHHISKVTSTCYYHLRRLHQIRNYVSRETMNTNRKSYELSIDIYRWPWMTLNDVMALILRYFTEFGSFRCALHKIGWRCRRKKVHVR